MIKELKRVLYPIDNNISNMTRTVLKKENYDANSFKKRKF